MFGTSAEELAAVWKTYERNQDWQTERRNFETQQEAMKVPVTLEATMDRIVRWINDKPATEQRIISTATTDTSRLFDTDKLIAAIQKGLNKGQQNQPASGSNSQSNNSQSTNKKIVKYVPWIEEDGTCKRCHKPGIGPPGYNRKHTVCAWCRVSCMHETDKCPYVNKGPWLNGETAITLRPQPSKCLQSVATRRD